MRRWDLTKWFFVGWSSMTVIVLVYLTSVFQSHYRYDIANILDIFTYILIASVVLVLVLWDDL